MSSISPKRIYVSLIMKIVFLITRLSYLNHLAINQLLYLHLRKNKVHTKCIHQTTLPTLNIESVNESFGFALVELKLRFFYWEIVIEICDRPELDCDLSIVSSPKTTEVVDFISFPLLIGTWTSKKKRPSIVELVFLFAWTPMQKAERELSWNFVVMLKSNSH